MYVACHAKKYIIQTENKTRPAIYLYQTMKCTSCPANIKHRNDVRSASDMYKIMAWLNPDNMVVIPPWNINPMWR